MPVLQKEAKIVPEGKDSSDQEGDQSGDQTNQQQGDASEGGGEGEQTEQASTEQGETSSVPVPDNRTAAGEGEGGEKEPDFPVDVLTSLDEQLNRPRWVVPVLPKSDLEQLLEASIKLARAGVDGKSEPCQRFFRDGLTLSFVRVLDDDAVNAWNPDIQTYIFNNTKLLVRLCAAKIDQDWFVLLELLARAFSPHCKWNMFNQEKKPEKVAHQAEEKKEGEEGEEGGGEEEVYAHPPEDKAPRGWLCDLINIFGEDGGFKSLHRRICGGTDALTVVVVAAQIRPFANCIDYLTDHCVAEYIAPVVGTVFEFLVGLSDEALKKESSTEAKGDTMSSILKSLRHLTRRVPTEHDIVQLRLKMILRLLKIASFSGKMNALNEINKVVPGHPYHVTTHYQTAYDEDQQQMTAEKMAAWIKDNNVLEVVLRDNLHQPQYVEKLEKMLRFCIREKVLSIEDLDKIWASQEGKHEAIVKNIHDLLAKLAWDFSPEQLDRLFKCFQRSWVGAMKKQRDELLEFIRRLAEDDKEGMMANKVLDMLWTLAKRDDCPPDTLDHALNAHLKILDFSCAQDRDNRKMRWLQCCINELEQGSKWVLPAMKHFREVCSLYPEPPPQFQYSRGGYIYYRTQVLQHIDKEYRILAEVIKNLQEYMDVARAARNSDETLNPETYCVDDRFNHFQQVQSRLDFIRFILRDGSLWLSLSHSLLVWKCLAEDPVFPFDREACLKWFSKLVKDEPDLEPDSVKHIFIENVMKLDPQTLTDNGFRCFDCFFRHVNCNDHKLRPWRRTLLTDSLELMGIEYLWEVILTAQQGIAHKAIDSMKDIYTNLTPQLKEHNVPEEFLRNCFEKMRRVWENLVAFKEGESAVETAENVDGYQQQVVELTRCLCLLKEYAAEMDECYLDERGFPPHGKSSWGRPVVIRVQYSHTRGVEEFEVPSHANETMASVRRSIKQQLKLAPSSHLEISCGADIILPQEDHKHVSTLAQRDRMALQVKVVSMGTNVGDGSSHDSSSDSDRVSPQFEGPNLDAEKGLPSVIISLTQEYTQFLLKIGDFALEHKQSRLKDSVRDLILLVPSDHTMVAEMLDFCREQAKRGLADAERALADRVLHTSQLRVLYNLELIQSLLMPATSFRDSECGDFQLNFVRCGGVDLLLAVLSDENRLADVDPSLKRAMYLCTVHMSRQMLLVQAFMRIYRVSSLLKSDQSKVDEETHRTALQLQMNIQQHILSQAEAKLKESAKRMAQFLHAKGPVIEVTEKMVESVAFLVWAAEANSIKRTMEPDTVHEAVCKFFSFGAQPETEIAAVFREGFEVLAILIALQPTLLGVLQSKPWWKDFVLDSLTRMKNRYLRMAAGEQIFVLAAQCSQDPQQLLCLVNLLIGAQEDVASNLSSTSSEYFKLLAKLLSHAINSNIQLPDMSAILDRELQWIQEVKRMYERQEGQLDSPLIEGHLNLTVELIHGLTPEERFRIGSEPGGLELIKLLVERFLFPASVLMQLLSKEPDVSYDDRTVASICTTTEATAAAFRVISVLCTGSLENLKAVYNKLQELFYSVGSDMTLTDWEYFPHLGPRPIKGFVGLRNAGATCYMNSVLQQLFMIPEVRVGVVQFDQCAELFEDAEDDDEKPLVTTGPFNRKEETGEGSPVPSPSATDTGDRKDSHRRVLMQLQSIFAHLLLGKLQAHAPRGFWKDFRLWGEKVNLREQHDAFEFFNCLVDNVDEGLKSYKETAIISGVLGGLFADQKICKDCPHRYTRAEPFTALNVDVRFQRHLFESLEAFVKGDLLEGNNAYQCEKCNKKVDTVKRLCIKKLPKVLVIQLKRFDYDWEREMAVKFNDYFEFPREFDMAPYTAAHLAKVEGEVIEEDGESDTAKPEESAECTAYSLRGIVVHSGQASGGHYYSFIRYKPPGSATYKWYKFDDSEVTEWKMDDDEELKSQCFGGEYTGEVYDQDLRRSQFRRQKRWWSAYLLFYERKDCNEAPDAPINTPAPELLPVIPGKVHSAVQRRNLRFSHHKSHFSHTYFTFIKQVLGANSGVIKSEQTKGSVSNDCMKLALLCTQLAAEFLFNVGFRTKRNLRGPANDWVEPLIVFLSSAVRVREWFANYSLLRHPSRLSEYLLECPSPEIRNAFARLLLYVCQESNKDPPYTMERSFLSEKEAACSSFTEVILYRLLELLKKEVPQHGRHLQQYFSFFMAFAYRTKLERQQLLKLDVPILFIGVSLDEGPGPPIRTPYADLAKLYPTVTNLVCCYDISKLRASQVEGQPPMPNPFCDQEVQVPLPPAVEEQLFKRPSSLQFSSNYLKKMLDENAAGDDTIRLLKFLCWENWDMSLIVLNELLSQLTTCQAIEVRQLTDLMMHLSLMEDSWQQGRMVAMLKGHDKMEGMVTIIQEAKSRYHKKAYLSIKFLVTLFHESQLAVSILYEDADLKKLWSMAIKWLAAELERRSYSSYPYSNWSPPVQSNEVSNSYFLERSNSAVLTLNKAYQVLPPDDPDPEEATEETAILPGGDPDIGRPASEDDTHDVESPDNRKPLHQISQTTTTTNSSLDHIDEEDLDVTDPDSSAPPPLADQTSTNGHETG